MGWGAFAKGFASTLDLQPAARQVSSGIQRRTARRDKLADDKRLRGERMDDAETLRDQSLEDQKAKEDRDAALYKQKTDAENQRYKDRRAAELAQGQQTFEQQEAAKAARREEDRTAESQALTKAQQEKEAKNRADYIAIKESVGEEAWNSSAYHQSIRGADSERAFSLGIISFSDYERQKSNVYKETQDDGTPLGAKFREEDAARATTNAKRDAQAKVLEDVKSWGSGGLGAPKPQPEPLSGLDLLRRPEGPASDGAETTQVGPPPLGGAEPDDSAVTEGEAPPEAASDAPSGQFKTWLGEQSPDLVRRWNEMPEETKARLRKAFSRQASASGGQAYQQMLGAPGAPA